MEGDRDPRNLVAIRVIAVKGRAPAEDTREASKPHLNRRLLARLPTRGFGRRFAGVDRTGRQRPSVTADLPYEQQPALTIPDKTCRRRPIQQVVSDLLA